MCYFIIYRKWEYYHQDYVYQFHNYFYRYPDVITSYHYKTLNERQQMKELMEYQRQVQIGKEYCLNQSIIIAGLIRNKVNNIPYLKDVYNTLKSHCQRILFLIIENNSTDDTRYELLQWANLDSSILLLCDKDEINQLSCQISGYEQPITDSNPFSDRICKLSHLRNIYMNYIYKNISPNEYSFFIVKDLDLQGELFLDGIFHSFYELQIHPNIEAIACNGLIRDESSIYGWKYYDSFAYIQLHEQFYWNNPFDKHSHDEEISKYLLPKYIHDMKMDKVISGFGGFCIYRLSSLFHRKPFYSCSRENQLVCEHSYFHSFFSNVYVNPKLIYLIS